MSIIKKQCAVECKADVKRVAQPLARSATFELEVGTAQTWDGFKADCEVLKIHPSQVAAKFWSQYVTDAQNVFRPELRDVANEAEARKGAAEAVAKFIASVQKPVGESRPMSEATAKRKAADKQANAIAALGAAIKSGDAKAKQLWGLIASSKKSLNEIAVVFSEQGADKAIAFAQS